MEVIIRIMSQRKGGSGINGRRNHTSEEVGESFLDSWLTDS